LAQLMYQCDSGLATTLRHAFGFPGRAVDLTRSLTHHLTGPMRKAATAEGNAKRMNLWGGAGHRHATAQPAAQILERLAERL
jgi:NAD(P)H-dependent flavin oxidoreductase YrpB (nitropropane dioxygenase family)